MFQWDIIKTFKSTVGRVKFIKKKKIKYIF